MSRRLEYVRAGVDRPIPAIQSSAPRLAALAFAAFFVVGWCVFFTIPIGLIDSHYTNRPQAFPQFQLTPWRVARAGKGSSGPIMTRDAILPLTMHTLRYTQETVDGGATIETVAYHADVRWGPTTVALVATAILPAVVYWGIKRALRVEKRSM